MRKQKAARKDARRGYVRLWYSGTPIPCAGVSGDRPSIRLVEVTCKPADWVSAMMVSDAASSQSLGRV